MRNWIKFFFLLIIVVPIVIGSIIGLVFGVLKATSLHNSKSAPAGNQEGAVYSELDGGSCQPEIGSKDSLLKIFVLNNAGSPFYNEHKDQIIEQLKTVSPFKENFSKIALYSFDVPSDQKISCQSYEGGGLSGSGYSCDQSQTDQFIRNKCGIRYTDRFVKVVIAETFSGGSGGEVIVVGSRPQAIKGVTNPQEDKSLSLDMTKNIFIHELGHNMGLGDLYYGTFYNNADPSRFLPPEIASSFPNTDKAGCPKWCKSFKSSTSYPSGCLKITNEGECRRYGRSETKSCLTETSCCVWDNQSFEYFGKCAPAYGEESIGINCLEGTGCYYGAAYGNDAWRPIKRSESIMYEKASNSFDPVSKRWLEQVITSCLGGRSSDPDENVKRDKFQEEYNNLISKLSQFAGFKKKIGLCGI